MSKIKKIIIGISVAILVVIGIGAAYKVIEKNIANRTDSNYKVDNIASSPAETESKEIE